MDNNNTVFLACLILKEGTMIWRVTEIPLMLSFHRPMIKILLNPRFGWENVPAFKVM